MESHEMVMQKRPVLVAPAASFHSWPLAVAAKQLRDYGTAMV